MKRISFLLVILLIFMSLICNVKITYAESNGQKESEIVIEKNTLRVLYEKDARQKMFMASTTKILTAITVIESCDINKIVKIKPEYVGIEGSSIYLKENEELTVKELLYGLMLSSGNDCAVTLAYHVGGNINSFAELMNNKAKDIGATNSHFTNPHGLHDDNHYTTAYDLAIITAYAMKNDTFREIVSTKRAEISDTVSGTKRVIINKNKMLFNFDGANGVKTGFTKKAGRCLVSSCIKNGIELICVVLNCGPMFETSTILLNEFSSLFSYQKLYNKDEIIDFVNVSNRKDILKNNRKCGIYLKNDIILPLKQNELNELKIKFDYNKELIAPVKENQNIGNINFYIKNDLIFSEKVYTINAIE